MSTLPEYNDSAETLLKKILEVYQNGGGIGPQGPAGTDGKTVRSGAGSPSTSLGVDGDFYIDTSNNLIYGPKTGGSWGSGTSIVGPVGPTGATGAAGEDGQSSSFYDYNAKTTATSGDPGNTFLLWNSGTQTAATQINVNHINADGYDIDILLALIQTGSQFFIQDSANSNNYQKWQVTATPTIQTNYVEFPVTLIGSGGTPSFTNGTNVLFIVATPAGGGTGGADLQEVWMHAGI